MTLLRFLLCYVTPSYVVILPLTPSVTLYFQYILKCEINYVSVYFKNQKPLESEFKLKKSSLDTFLPPTSQPTQARIWRMAPNFSDWEVENRNDCKLDRTKSKYYFLVTNTLAYFKDYLDSDITFFCSDFDFKREDSINLNNNLPGESNRQGGPGGEGGYTLKYVDLLVEYRPFLFVLSRCTYWASKIVRQNVEFFARNILVMFLLVNEPG